MPGPDASFYGSIVDSVGGGLIEQDIISGSRIYAYEHGYENPTAVYWDFKVTGEFRNNMVFAATYDLQMQNGNYFPFTIKDFVIKPGENTYTFSAVPYLRVLNPEIKLDEATNKIVATFNIQGGKPTVKMKTLTLYAYSDQYVGFPIKYTLSGADWKKTFAPRAIVPDPTVTYTLTIDLTANSNTFIKGRNYFFRIGAIADVSGGLAGVKTNYAPVVKMRL
jgi:hypothetical protein